MATWFCGDHHFFHGNIIHKFRLRPEFNNVKEMHSYIIEKHNQYVKDGDVCYFLGDIAMLSKDNINKIEPLIRQMNGRKHLVMGNHDDNHPFTYEKMGFDSVHTAMVLPEDNKFILTHDPSKSIIDKNKFWIVGHVHDLFVIQKNCINVGLDAWNYRPVSFKTVKNMFYTYGFEM